MSSLHGPGHRPELQWLSVHRVVGSSRHRPDSQWFKMSWALSQSLGFRQTNTEWNAEGGKGTWFCRVKPTPF